MNTFPGKCISLRSEVAACKPQVQVLQQCTVHRRTGKQQLCGLHVVCIEGIKKFGCTSLGNQQPNGQQKQHMRKCSIYEKTVYSNCRPLVRSTGPCHMCAGMLHCHATYLHSGQSPWILPVRNCFELCFPPYQLLIRLAVISAMQANLHATQA